jgi:hypothetical protein
MASKIAGLRARRRPSFQERFSRRKIGVSPLLGLAVSRWVIAEADLALVLPAAVRPRATALVVAEAQHLATKVVRHFCVPFGLALALSLAARGAAVRGSRVAHATVGQSENFVRGRELLPLALAELAPWALRPFPVGEGLEVGDLCLVRRSFRLRGRSALRCLRRTRRTVVVVLIDLPLLPLRAGGGSLEVHVAKRRTGFACCGANLD